MAPFVHGGIYPEREGATLASRELRVLIDHRSVTNETAGLLREIDVLRHYLRDVPGQPCIVSLLAQRRPNDDSDLVAQVFQLFNVQLVPAEDVSSASVTTTLGLAPDEHAALAGVAAAAVVADADVLVTLDPAAPERADAFKTKLHVAAEDWSQVKTTCEIFARGHEVPWAFDQPVWGFEWGAFYTLTEPKQDLHDFHHRVVASRRFSDATCEYVRSSFLNRHEMLCYTRDKLLFFALQRRAAVRHKVRNAFIFDVAYFLNHYYLLLWGGLDQLALALNGLFDLGLNDKSVGLHARDFKRRLGQKAPTVAALLEGGDFKEWARLLAAVRHFVAHRGVALPQDVLLRTHEVTPEELDAKIEQQPAWQRMVSYLGREMMEHFRATWRDRMLREEYQTLPEPMLTLELDGQTVMIPPLVNVRWDFDNFYRFVSDVVAETRKALAL